MKSKRLAYAICALSLLFSSASTIHASEKDLTQVITIGVDFQNPKCNQVLQSGQSGNLEGSILFDRTPVEPGTIQWSSDNPEMLKVTDNSKWEALEPGETILWTGVDLTRDDYEKINEALNLPPEYAIISDPEGITLYIENGREKVYRVYNPNSGEHFYTISQKEKEHLVKAGWKDEGVLMEMPTKSSSPIYRLYNPNAGDHHYTSDRKEVDYLVRHGWKDEGVAFYNTAKTEAEVFRLYNPNAKAGAHHFTQQPAEKYALMSQGWIEEENDWMPYTW